MADYNIIGREYEQRTLQSICEETEAKLVAVFGRRRVGKKKLLQGKFRFLFYWKF
jgi:AAA+ ATPase superfamily predicted ATPase